MVVTENEVRRLALAGQCRVTLAAGDILTPAARDYLCHHGIPLETASVVAPAEEMSRRVIPTENGQPLYVNEVGHRYYEKPEHMTHLFGNVLVAKTNARIDLRGRLDLLEAHILATQVNGLKHGFGALAADLGEALEYVRRVLACEVKEEPFLESTLFGYTAADLREVSHHPERYFGIPHLVPNATMGPELAAVNILRAQTRRCELAAVVALQGADGAPSQPSLIQALNRLSSGFYILMCRLNSGHYPTAGGAQHG